MKIVNFFELAADFDLKPVEAIKHFQTKGLKPTFAWADMLGDEHDTAFTVAKMMDTDLLKTVQDKLTDALNNGSTLQDFKRDLIPTLQKAGWWGKKDLLDPVTGEIVNAQLGSASRLETIFRSNIQSAYSVGHWDKISQSARTAPFLMYDAVDDGRTRPEHAARNGQVHPVNSEFWKTHFPPNGYNCRCGVIQLDQDDLDDMGLKPEPSPGIKTHPWKNPRTGAVLDVPDDVDPGWDHNPGQARKAYLHQLADDKAGQLLDDQRKAMKAALAQQKIEQAAYEKAIAKDKAVKALDDAVANNSPYLANEIKKLKAANPNMDPEALLAKAQDKALKSEQNSLVQSWKQAKKKGKEPSLNSQAYINSLPDEVQAALLKDVEKFSGAAKAKEALAGYMNDLQHPDYALRKEALIKYSPGLGDNPNKLLELVDQAVADAKLAATNNAMTELALIQDGKAAKQPGLKKKILDKMGAQAAVDAAQDPAKLLKQIEDEAAAQQAAAEKSSVLSGYKKKVLEGKIPSPKQQQVFNTLTDAEKNKVLEDINAKKPKAAAPVSPAPPAAQAAPIEAKKYADLDQEQKYQLMWDAFDGEEAGFPGPDEFKTLTRKGKAAYVSELESLIDDVADADGTTATQELDKLVQIAADNGSPWAIKSSKAAATAQAAADASVLKAAQEAADDALDDIIPAQPAPAGTAINTKSLTQTAGQGGSNPGGEFLDTETGVKWYIKAPKSLDYARNEVLAAKLYEAAGIEVPEVNLIKGDGLKIAGATPEGDIFLASKIIDDLKKNKKALLNGAPGVADGFIVDAWLANWDVVGLEYDNLLLKSGRAVRVDTGGALRYRARGEKKSADMWGDIVRELKSLRDETSAQSQAVFGKLSREELIASARRVVAITDKQIDDLLDQYGPVDAAERAKLSATLKARRDYIAGEFPEAKVARTPETAPSGAAITPVEELEISNARINGYTRLTDKDDIEDHNVRITEINAGGKKKTKLSLKLTDKAIARLEKESGIDLTTAKERPAYSLTQSKAGYQEMAKGIGALANKGEVFRQKDLDRLVAVNVKITDDIKALQDGIRAKKYTKEAAEPAIEKLKELLEEVRWMANKAKVGEKAIPWRRYVDPDNLPSMIDEIVEEAKPGNKAKVAWKKERATYAKNDITKSHAHETGGEIDISHVNHRLTANVDGVTVKVYPADKKVLYIRGYVEVEVEGQGAAAAERALDALKAIGVNADRADEATRLRLFLDQTAHQLYFGRNADEYKAYKKLKSDSERLEKLNGTVGFDITKTSHYTNREDSQAFGHGRKFLLRSDLDTPEYKTWAKDHSIYHSLGTLSKQGYQASGSWEQYMKPIFEGGGMLSSLLDRIRRGLPISSHAGGKDFTAGGAASVFTRIKRRGAKELGFYWRPDRHMRRMDRISLDSDNYGDVRESARKNDGLHTVEDWTRAASMGGDETTFKDGLSLFDDLEKIVVWDEAERRKAIADLRAMGYDRWPDDRRLEDIIVAAH